jgi:hypothetical protein
VILVSRMTYILPSTFKTVAVGVLAATVLLFVYALVLTFVSGWDFRF